MVWNIFSFHPEIWGNDPIWLINIFQLGWFNHQPEILSTNYCTWPQPLPAPWPKKINPFQPLRSKLQRPRIPWRSIPSISVLDDEGLRENTVGLVRGLIQVEEVDVFFYWEYVKTPSTSSKKLSNAMQHDCISTYMIAMSGDIATPKVVRSKKMSSFNRS